MDNANRSFDIKIAYIGGGSQKWARNLMNDLALENRMSGTVALYDINYEAALLNEKIGNLISRQPAAGGRWAYQAVQRPEDALTDADFVIMSILPGTFEEMASDVHLPEKYEIYQSVGDTVGPGGLMRALRAIPIYADYAEKIKRYAPDAWVINYTNPMSLCVRTLYEVFPDIKAIGCCHEVLGVKRLLAEMLRDLRGIEVKHLKEIQINVLGINHFTWIDRASYGMMDLIPLYRKFVDKYYDEGFEIVKGTWEKDVFQSCHRVKFDLFRRFGVIAAAGDRHLAEFMPPWYLKEPETVRSWKFHLTPVDTRVQQLTNIIEKNKRLLAGEEAVSLNSSGEEGVDIIRALLGMGDFITNVNLPNRGQMPGMPTGAVVETNAWFGKDCVQPLVAGQLPMDVHQMVLKHVWNQESILQAALKRDKRFAFHAFVNDPLVNLSLDEAEKLFREMLGSIKKYLPGWTDI